MHGAGGEAKADGHGKGDQVRRPEAQGEDPAQTASGQRKRAEGHEAGLTVSGQALGLIDWWSLWGSTSAGLKEDRCGQDHARRRRHRKQPKHGADTSTRRIE